MFITPDSIVPDWSNPQSLNRYAYCLNNPLIYTDPSGHYWIENEERSGVYDQYYGPSTKDNYQFDSYLDDIHNRASSSYSLDLGRVESFTNDYGTYYTTEGSTYDRNGSLVNQAGAPTIPIEMYITGLGGIAKSGFSLTSKLLFNYATKKSASLIQGPFGSISTNMISKLSNSSGSVTPVFTKLTSAPAAGRALSVSVGETSLANAARESGQIYSAKIPTALTCVRQW